MKLVNKILPALTTIGAVCSIPCTLTSCGGNNDGWTKYTYDPEHMDIYEYVTPVGGTLSTDSDTATKFYLEAINNKKKILADDIAYDHYNSFNNQKNGFFDLIQVSIGDINTEQLRISIEEKHSSPDINKVGFVTAKFNNVSISVSNFSFANEDEYIWDIQHTYDVDKLQADHNWSISETAAEGRLYYYDWQSSADDLDFALTLLDACLLFPSYYLSETAPLNPF